MGGKKVQRLDKENSYIQIICCECDRDNNNAMETEKIKAKVNNLTLHAAHIDECICEWTRARRKNLMEQQAKHKKNQFVLCVASHNAHKQHQQNTSQQLTFCRIG